MKILHVDSGREMRGGQWQVLRLHKTLIESGHDSFLLAREGAPLLAAAIQHCLPCASFRPLRLAHFSRQFDIMHAHDAHSHTWGALFSRVPLVVSRRVAFPLRQSVGSRWKYSQAARYLAVSHFVAGKLIETGIDSSRIDVVYDGVEIPPTLSQGNLLIAPFTHDPAKGMKLAQESASLAGMPLHLSHNLEADLPRARTMLYLTQSEGLGSGILLAMAHGVSVIASRTGGIPELIEDGVTGLLVKNEPNSIAEAVRKVDPALGRNARHAVESRFTIENMTRATLDSYKRALNA